MKTTQSIIVTAALLFCGMAAHGQNTFFPTRAGMSILYANKDAKGKANSYTRHTIKEVEGSGNNLTISYLMENLDKNMKPQTNQLAEIPCTVIIKDGVVILDMNEMLSQMNTTGLKAEITGVPMEIPGNLQAGQSLKDANMTLTVEAGIIKMRTDIKMTDGKCEAIEDITVAAGTFTCHKITQTITTTVMRKEVVAKSVAWYAPNIGTVKTESYDSKNKLTGIMELMSVEN